MVRRPDLGACAVLVLAGGPLLASPAAAAVPPWVEACLDGGWRSVVDGEGREFSNQGTCIRWKLQTEDAAVDLGVLAGSFEGGSFVDDTPLCPFVRQYLYASYVPDGAAEAIELGMEGCLQLGDTSGTATYAGDFSIDTAAGGISGTVAGTVFGASTPEAVYDLTLTVTAGTGAFEGATGVLQVEIVCNWMRLGMTTTGVVSTS